MVSVPPPSSFAGFGCRQLGRIVAPFADVLLSADFPDLPSDRRAEVVRFIERRAATVPSFTRFGVTVIGALYRMLMAAPGGDRIVCALAAMPIPVVGDYPRLVRSLGYAYIWDRWPDTTSTGGRP
jgi:hypothetical protein